MGNYDNYCTCLGIRQEKTNNEIKTDSYHLPLKEEPVIVKKKSRSFHESNKYVSFIDKENDDDKKRLDKSRGLRKLLNKKAKEKKETLKLYFFRFYRAGIISKRQDATAPFLW